MNCVNRSIPMLVLIGSLSSPAAAQEARIGIELRGVVELNCRVVLDAQFVAIAPGDQSVGVLDEACNNSAGYRIYVDRSDELAPATLIVDGRPFSLAGSAPILVVERRHAGHARRPVSLSMPGDVRGGFLSFQIAPL